MSSQSRIRDPAPPRGVPARTGVVAALGLVVLGVLGVGALDLVFVHTRQGQRLDEAALQRVTAHPSLTRDIVLWLNELTVGVVVVVLAACMLVALVRRRWTYALAALVLVGGANVTTQLIKYHLLTRPELGYGSDNTLPSGHTTVTMSLLLAMLLVLPQVSRGALVLVGSVAASMVGVGLVVAGWHRPSDVLAALGVCLAWSGLVSCGLLLWSGAGPGWRVRGPAGYQLLALVGAAVAVALVYAFGVRPDGGWKDLVVHGFTVASIGLGSALCLALAARTMPVDDR